MENKKDKPYNPNHREWVKHTLRHQKYVNGEWVTITTVYYRRKTR